MSRKIVLVIAFIIVVIGTLGAERSFAQKTVGVSVGLSVEGYYVYSGNGTMPPTSQMMELVKVTVQQISGTNITFQQITRYADMHEDTTIYLIDVESGQGNATGSFIAANLSEGDLIYTSPPPSDWRFQGATINETIFREYLGANVEVNHYNCTRTGSVTEGNVTMSFDYYWNKATGMPVEASWYELLKPEVGNPTWVGFRASIMGLSEVFHVVIDITDYAVTVNSNSTITDFTFNKLGKQISFNATGHTGEMSYCNVTIPKNLLTGNPWIIKVDSTTITDFDENTNNTHTFLYFTYTHESPLRVTIEGTWVIPEIPSAIILPLFTIISLTVVFVKLKVRAHSNGNAD